MTRRKRLALMAAAVVLVTAQDAQAEDPVAYHFKSGVTITSAAGNVRELPPGWYFPEPALSALDTELRRAQDAETRLLAENDSLRKSSQGHGFGWRGGLVIAATAFAAGIGTAVYAWHQ